MYREVEKVDLGQLVVGPKQEQEAVFDEVSAVLAGGFAASDTSMPDHLRLRRRRGGEAPWERSDVAGAEGVGKRQGTRADAFAAVLSLRLRSQYLWDVTITHSDLDYMKKVHSLPSRSFFKAHTTVHPV